ncbi:hypothetical protein C8A05DRAFT_41118 [Staphylotrichum tortipilum]|uniref:Protein disulfide-isomerase n=1 Tax=Staphylotrichum tortipilum TaxID=2831512 RepID=A0AAN6RXR5_9PEZI|nr:hypothetical protein C8A05DRAFT_41118 [Staphylotrichum longicolle]
MRFNDILPLLLLTERSVAWNHASGAELLDGILNGQERVFVAYKLVSVDCSAEAQVCRRFDVSSFPTIRLHHPDGTQARYRGPRKAASITAFLRRSTHPAVSYVTDKNATAFHSIDDVVLVGRFKRGTNLRQQFMIVAKQYSDRYSFALAEPQQGTQMECFNNADDVQLFTTEFPGPMSIEAFVKLCSTPLIPELTRRNELSFYETKKSIVHYFVRDDKAREAYVAELRPLAKKYAEYLHFTTTDAHDYADAAEMMGLGRGSTGLSVQNPNNGEVFPYTRRDKITAASVEAFLGDIIQGKVAPWNPTAGHDEL